MGNIASREKNSDQLYIHVFNTKKNEFIEISTNYNLNRYSLPNYVCRELKTIDFTMYNWDSYDGKIVIYFIKNKHNLHVYSYGYYMNPMDDNCTELNIFSVNLDDYFTNEPMFSITNLTTIECTYVSTAEFTMALKNNTTTINIDQETVT